MLVGDLRPVRCTGEGMREMRGLLERCLRTDLWDLPVGERDFFGVRLRRRERERDRDFRHLCGLRDRDRE